MRLHRFYVLQPLGEEVVIDDVSLVSQWTKVFRYKPTDFVILFNGDGYNYRYVLESVTKKTCILSYQDKESSYIPRRKVSLYLSLIKKDNFELVVQKATELGVSSITPILSSRSEKKNLSFERLQKIAIESSEQCGRGDIPIIKPIITLEEAISSLPEESLPIMFTMNGAPYRQIYPTKSTQELALFIGPEGGWSEEDLEKSKKRNIQEYSLGNTVLRAETAAIVACASTSLLLD